MLEICIWIAIALVITLRSLAVYSHHFIQESQTGLGHQILGWFRFYKRGFSLTLGLVTSFGSSNGFSRWLIALDTWQSGFWLCSIYQFSKS